MVPLYSIISRENKLCVQKAYRDDVDSTFLIRSDILSWVIAHYGAVLSGHYYKTVKDSEQPEQPAGEL